MSMLSADALRARARSPQGRTAIKYTLTSAVAVAVNQVVLFTLFGVFHWAARWANVSAVAVSTVPSYVLNRHWAWGKRGKSHLWKEVVPFWALAFVGLAFSTWAADWAETAFNKSALAVNGAALGA